MNVEEYLSSKKIDSDAFRNAEPSTWEAWKTELEQMHPNSFTIQKLNLINPVRRKYPLKQSGLKREEQGARSKEQEAGSNSEAKIVEGQTTSTPPRPVFKPKPKIN